VLIVATASRGKTFETSFGTVEYAVILFGIESI